MKQSEQEWFYALPRWLREDILREEAGDNPVLKEKYVRRIRTIESRCQARGYGLLPTRGDLSLSVARNRKARRPVGDFSILGEE